MKIFLTWLVDITSWSKIITLYKLIWLSINLLSFLNFLTFYLNPSLILNNAKLTRFKILQACSSNLKKKNLFIAQLSTEDIKQQLIKGIGDELAFEWLLSELGTRLTSEELSTFYDQF